MVRDVPDDVLVAAHARAKQEQRTLTDVLRSMLRAYSEGKDFSSMGGRGGSSRAAKMTAEQRSAAARHAARRRWGKAKSGGRGGPR